MTRGDRVCQFIEAHLCIPEGSQAGKPIVLAPFQRRFILDVFDNPAGTRRGILSMARKNGKTALIAAIMLAFLCGPEARPNQQVVSGAMSRDQAAMVYRYAKGIALLSPDIRDRVRCVDSSKRIVGLKLNTEYRALAADGATAQGLSPVLVVLDEVGQVRGPTNDFFDALVRSQGAHSNPLLLAISTQAATDADLLSLWIDDALTGRDPRIVCHLHAASEGCGLTDDAAWMAANPALGLFRSREDVELQASEAMAQPSQEALFRLYTLNQRIEVHSPLVSRRTWEANGGEVLPFAGPVWGGLDLSQTTDLTAFVLIGRDVAGNWAVRPHFWMAGDLVSERTRADREPYDVWSRQGYLNAPSGKSIDYPWVASQIAEIVAPLDMRGVAFDRHRMGLLTEAMGMRGVSFGCELVPWGQGYVSMTPAVDALEIELLNERIRHGGHPVLQMCARNAVVKRDEAGNRKLDKSKSTGRIDGMVALAMAIGLAMTQDSKPAPSPMVMVLD
jgi:phage terminase large subunit-like protein